MPACFGCFLNHERHARRTFLECRTRAVPREGPAPIHANFVVWIDQIFSGKLVSKNFGAVLSDRDSEVFVSLRPVSVADPKCVLAFTRNFQILIQRAATLVGACGRRVPFTFTSLGPFS